MSSQPIISIKIDSSENGLNASAWPARSGQDGVAISISDRKSVSALQRKAKAALSGNWSSCYVPTYLTVSQAQELRDALDDVIDASQKYLKEKAKAPKAPAPKAATPGALPTHDDSESAPDLLTYLTACYLAGKTVLSTEAKGLRLYVRSFDQLSRTVRLAAGTHKTAKLITVSADSIIVE